MFVIVKKDVPSFPLNLQAPWEALRKLPTPIPLSIALRTLGERFTSHNLPEEAVGVLEELIDAGYAKVVV